MGMEWLSGGGSCGNGRGKRMGRTPCGQTLFCQPPHFCRGGYLIRPAEELHKSAFSLGGKGSLLCFVGFGLPGRVQNRFFFCSQKKKRFWTPKKKRWTGGNLGEVRYNRIEVLR